MWDGLLGGASFVLLSTSLHVSNLQLLLMTHLPSFLNFFFLVNSSNSIVLQESTVEHIIPHFHHPIKNGTTELGQSWSSNMWVPLWITPNLPQIADDQLLIKFTWSKLSSHNPNFLIEVQPIDMLTCVVSYCHIHRGTHDKGGTNLFALAPSLSVDFDKSLVHHTPPEHHKKTSFLMKCKVM